MGPRQLRLVRWAVIAVCAVGIAGMIVASIADATGAALTFGLVTAVSILCLIVATTVAGGGPGPGHEGRAARVEELVATLVGQGADEATVRALVAEASRMREAAQTQDIQTPDA